MSSHTLAPTPICDLSHSVCGSTLTDLGHIFSVTYVCHPLWFVGGHRKGILTSPHTKVAKKVPLKDLLMTQALSTSIISSSITEI